MLWTIGVILLILWLLGLVSGHTMGGFVHILLVIAIIVVVVRLIQGRKSAVAIQTLAGNVRCLERRWRSPEKLCRLGYSEIRSRRNHFLQICYREE